MPGIAHPPTLDDLPPPPPGKSGWPWTLSAAPAPPATPAGRPWPRLSIVTPSYNQGNFLEETLRSVLLQQYPNLEYLVIDGGSTDGTAAVLERYRPFLAHLVSEPDRGQSHALNKGLAHAAGDLLGWQNSDDFYAPGAFHRAAEAWLDRGRPDVVYGQLHLIDADSRLAGAYPTSRFDPCRMFPWANMFNQSMFFSRRLLEDAYPLDEDFHHCMDYELFWRLILKGCRFEYVPELDAFFRLHEQAKGSRQSDVAAREFFAIYQMLYHRAELPEAVRKLALQSMRGLCIDHFGKRRWDLFHAQLRALIDTAGRSRLGPRLLPRYLLSFLGDEMVERLLNLRHAARSFRPGLKSRLPL
jgi:glycosyltransferase involved in cell wall biosynthesis